MVPMSEQTSDNLFDIFRDRFQTRLNGRFVATADERTFTYTDLDRISAQYANVLTARGVGPGDRVAAQIENHRRAFFFTSHAFVLARFFYLSIPLT